MNRGDWAEIYVILYIVTRGKVFLGDENISKINEYIEIHKVEFYKHGTKYRFEVLDNLLIVTVNEKNKTTYSLDDVNLIQNSILKSIQSGEKNDYNRMVGRVKEFYENLFAKIKFNEITKKKYDVTIYLNNGEKYNFEKIEL